MISSHTSVTIFVGLNAFEQCVCVCLCVCRAGSLLQWVKVAKCSSVLVTYKVCMPFYMGLMGVSPENLKNDCYQMRS